MDGSERIRPSSWYYLLAFLFFVGGIGMMIYFLVAGVHRIRDSMVRMDIPGQMDLELKQSETYTVFAEHAVGSVTPDMTPRSVHCEVHMLPSGETIKAKPLTGSSSYSVGSRRAVSILEFEVPHDGTYMVACQGPAKIFGQSVQAAVGGGASKAITAVVGKSFLVLMAGLVTGVLIFLRVGKLRLESRREIREQGLKPV
jgi:hypothetical protein